MTDKSDDTLLDELTGAPQRWRALCRDAVKAGREATVDLLGPSDETAVLARRSLARWKHVDQDDLLEEESEGPDPQDMRITADLSAARAMAMLAQALTGAIGIDQACTDFLDHCERAGLRSVGTQLLPPGIPITSTNAPLRDIVLHLLGQGGRSARGYAILAALELAGQRPVAVRGTAMSVLLVNHGGHGEVGVLQLEQVRGGPSGLHPDPARMGFLQADRAFLDSFTQAWQISRLATGEACVRWSVTVGRGAPANDINGASMGAALAVALDDLAPRYGQLRRLRPYRLDHMCAVTAGLSGTSLTMVDGYGEKLKAAQQHSVRVVVAAEGYAKAIAQAPQNYCDKIASARTVFDAVRRARTRINFALWLVSTAAILATVLVIATGVQLAHVRALNALAQAEANSRLYANVARNSGRLNASLAQQIALSSYRVSPTEDARSALIESSAANAPIRVAPGSGGVVYIDDGPRIATTTDGDLVAIGEDNGTVGLVRVTQTGLSRLPWFATDSGPIRGLAISADQHWLVVAGQHESSLWNITDPASASRVSTLPTQGHQPWTAAVSPDNGLLTIGSQDGMIFTWRFGNDPAHIVALPAFVVPEGHNVTVTLSDRALVAAVDMSPHGTWSSTVRLWDTATLGENPVPVVDRLLDRPAGGLVRSVEFIDAGRVLALGLNSGEVKRWRIGNDLADWTEVPSFVHAGNEYFDVAVDSTGSKAAVVEGDLETRIRDLTTGEELGTFATGMTARARFVRGGQSLVTSGLDHTISIFDLPGATIASGLLTVFRFPADTADRPAASSPNVLFPRLRAVARVPFPSDRDTGDGDPSGLLDFVSISPDGKRAATLNESSIQVWDISDPGRPARWGPPLNVNWYYDQGGTFTPDGKLMIGNGLDASVDIFDITDRRGARLESTIRFNRGFPTAVSLSPDGRLLAVGSYYTGNVSVFERDRAGAVTPFGELSGIDSHALLMTLAVSSRDTLAVGTAAGVALFQLKRGESPRPIPLPAAAEVTSSVAFNADGTRLASTIVQSQGVRIWDLSDLEHAGVYATLLRGRAHWKKSSISFSGSILTESAGDGTLRQWNIDVPQEIRKICASGTAPITPAEWERALPGRPYIHPCPQR
ncbi:WD40 repeat domain-containing protein [Nocardia sp. NPDC051052]|uniref:WD40 repeat domain-containing protein n=1 Tax=Nocardia sp. NPDC051052 TaxID=3364322 RepID=UPI0037B6041E